MSNSTLSFRERLQSLLDPAHILSLAVYYFVVVVLETVFMRFDVTGLLKVSKLRDEAFGRFWLYFSSGPRETDPSKLVGSAALVPKVLQHARGDVLEIGPGSGSQIMWYPKGSLINKIYGAEPVQSLHEQIRNEAEAAGLGRRYNILTCGAEVDSLVPTLAKQGLLQAGLASDGVFDTIVTIRVLCSVSHEKETLDSLYSLLKPGGSLLLVEHVVNPWMSGEGSILARIMQKVYTLLGWKFFVGDCEMERDTYGKLIDVAASDGGWGKIDLERSFGWSALPYLSGQLTKRQR